MPNTPQAQHHLAEAARHLRARRPAAAIPYLQAASSLMPGNANILHDLGLASLETGQVPAAITALRAAIAASPGYADAHLRLGIALEAQGDHLAALAAYRQAAALQPTLADAQYRAGSLLDSAGQHAQAAAAFRAAAAAAPDTLLGRIAAARAQLTLNDTSGVEARLRHALTLAPANATVLDLLGNLLADEGRFEEARAILLQAIDASPLFAGSYYDVVRCRRITPEDAPLLARMRRAAALPGLDASQRSRVQLALGRAHEDLRDYPQAMRHFDAAEAERNTTLRFSLEAYEARIGRLIARFTPATIAAARQAPDTAPPRPILIIGLPRSGTTLVEQILSAHPAVLGGGEIPFWNEQGLIWDRLDQSGAAMPLPEIAARAAPAYRQHLRSVAANAACARDAGGAAVVTDKLPLNFQWAGLIHAALPDAILIHCRRHPADTALSIHQTHFNPRMAFPTGGAALVGYIRATQRLCAHWRQILPPDSFIDLDYETLTAAPEATIRRLLTACGLAWEEACLHPERNTRVVRTPSKYQVRRPITPASGKRASFAPYFGGMSPLLQAE